MAFYYVKAGGTAAGDGGRSATVRTGPWTGVTSEYYATLTDAVNASTAPVSGDAICISDASSDTNASSTTVTIPDGVSVISVSDAEVETFTPATSAQVASTGTAKYEVVPGTDSGLSINTVLGCYFESKDSTNLSVAYANNVYYDATLEIDRSGIEHWLINSARSLLVNSKLKHSNGNLWFRTDGRISMRGGEIDSGTRSYVLRCDYGTQTSCLSGVNFSSPNGTQLVFFNSSDRYNDTKIHILGCTLPAGWTISTPNSIGDFALVESCTSAYQWYLATKEGEIDFVTDVHYDAHDTLSDGLTRGSFEFETTADCSANAPLGFGNLMHEDVIAAVNNEAATKTKVRLRFVPLSGYTLDSADLEVHVGYPSGASYLMGWVYHRVDALSSGVALQTEPTSGNWTGVGLAATAYYLDIDMPSPDNGRVVVIPAVTKPNVTVYFSWQLEFVA